MGYQFESSNPTLSSMRDARSMVGDETDTATLKGVADKTALLVGLATIAGGVSYALFPLTGGVMLACCLATLVIGIGIAWSLAGNPANARVLAPVYALVEGTFLGLVTKWLDFMLLSAGGSTAAVGGSLALPAFVITISCVVAMLVLYRAGILRPTETFRSVIYTFTAGVMLAYFVMFILSFFGVQVPFLSLGSAMQGGRAALIGIGLNVAILGLASLWLIIDFGQVEGIVRTGQPKVMEWYGGFVLLVTLAWIYYEAVKLAFRVAMATQRRD